MDELNKLKDYQKYRMNKQYLERVRVSFCSVAYELRRYSDVRT